MSGGARSQRKLRLREHYRRLRELDREVREVGDATTVLQYIEMASSLGLTVGVFAHDERLLHDVYSVAGEDGVIGYITVTTESVSLVPTD